MSNWECKFISENTKYYSHFALSHPFNRILAVIEVKIATYKVFKKSINFTEEQYAQMKEQSEKVGEINFIRISMHPVCSQESENYFRDIFRYFDINIHLGYETYDFILSKNTIPNFIAIFEDIQTKYPREDIQTLIPFMQEFAYNYAEVINPPKKLSEFFRSKPTVSKISAYSNPYLKNSDTLITSILSPKHKCPKEVCIDVKHTKSNNVFIIITIEHKDQIFPQSIANIALIFVKKMNSQIF